jgi:hypothetical protein
MNGNECVAQCTADRQWLVGNVCEAACSSGAFTTEIVGDVELFKCADSCTVYVQEEVFGKSYQRCHISCPATHPWLVGSSCEPACQNAAFILEMVGEIAYYRCAESCPVVYTEETLFEKTYRRCHDSCAAAGLKYDTDGRCDQGCLDGRLYVSGTSCVARCTEEGQRYA